MTQPSLRELAKFIKMHLECQKPIDEIITLIAGELIVSNRQRQVDRLLKLVDELYEQEERRASIHIETANPITTKNLRFSLEADLKKYLSLTAISATYSTQPSVSSGFIATSSTIRIDASGRRTLQRLTKEAGL